MPNAADLPMVLGGTCKVECPPEGEAGQELDFHGMNDPPQKLLFFCGPGRSTLLS